MADIVSRLVLSTSQFNQAIDQAGRHVGEFSRSSGRSIQGFSEKLSRIGTLANTVAGLGIFAGIGKLFQESTQAAIGFESAFAGVRKTVEATEAEFADLAARFTELSTATPVSREELARIGELAGQLGVAGVDNLEKFADTIARISVSTNLTAEQAATDFARLANVMGLPIDQVDRLGSTVVALGNNFATTEQEISSMAQRLSGAARTLGLTTQEVLSISAALSAVGIEAEAGGTAFSKVFIKLAQAASEGNEAVVRLLGTSTDGLRTLVQNNPAEAVLQFVEALGRVKAEGGDLFQVLAALDISEIRLRDSLLRTANAGSVLREAMVRGGEAFVANNALLEESNKRFSTTESTIKTLSNTFSTLSGELGNAILPAIREFAETMVPIIKGVVEWAKENPNLVKSLLAMAGVVAVGGALLAGVGALALAFSALGAVGGPVLVAAAAITGLVGAFVGLKDKVPAAIDSVTDAIAGLVDAFAKGLAEKADSLVQSVGVALSGINKFFSELPSRAFRSGVALVDEFAKGLASRAQAAVDAVGEMVGKVRNFLPFSPAKEGPLRDLDKSGEAFGKTLAEGIARGAEQPADAARDLAERLNNEIQIRGSIPTRGAGGQFLGSVSRTGTTFFEGVEESLNQFAIRTKDAFSQGVTFADAAVQSINQAFEGLATDAVEGKINSLKDVFTGLRDVAISVLQDIARQATQILVNRALTSIITSFGGGLATGNQGGVVLGFAGGGMVPGLGFSDTVPALLTPGEGVISRTGMEALARLNQGSLGTAPAPQVIINNYTGEPVRTEEERTSGGGFRTHVFVGQAGAQNIRQRGDMFRAISDTFGLRPVAGRRG
ncbi:MAG: phage tail tape measure protein [Nitrospirales bacterium]